MYKSLILILMVAIGVGFLVVPNALALDCNTEWVLGCDIIPEACTGPDAASECELNDLILTFIHIAQWILAIVGSLALLMFIYGGFTWITAAGNSSRVDEGRKIIIGTVVGLVIVLAAFQIVRLVGSLLGPGGDPPAEFETYLEK